MGNYYYFFFFEVEGRREESGGEGKGLEIKEWFIASPPGGEKLG